MPIRSPFQIKKPETTSKIRPLSFQTSPLPQKTAQSTPSVISPEFKTVAEVIDPRKKFTIRPPFAKEGEVKELRGGPIIQATTEIASRLLEFIPRIAAVTVANVQEVSQEQLQFKGKIRPFKGVDLGFDITRLGLEPESEEERTVLQSTGDRLVQNFNKRMKENPEKVKKNIALAVLEVPIIDTIDAFFAGDVAAITARAFLRKTKFNPQLETALQELGIKASDVTQQTLKNTFVKKAERLIAEEKFAELDKLGRATSVVTESLTGKGIPQLNRLGQLIQDTSRIALQDVRQGLRIRRPLAAEIAPEGPKPLELGGFKTAKGETDLALGLRIKKVEKVGGEAEKPKKPTAQEKFLADLERTKAEAPAAKVERVPKEEEVSLEALAKQREEVPSGEQVDALLRDITTGPEDPKIARFTKEDVDQVRLQLSFIQEAVEAHPARKLVRFISSKTGDLPEVTGIGKSQFGKRGDDIVTELGFGDVAEAQASLAEFRDIRKRFIDAMDELRADVKKARSFKELEKAKEKINRVVEIVRQKAETADVQVLKNTIRKEISSTVAKVEGGIKKGKLDPKSQKKIDKYREIMSTRNREKALKRIEENKAQFTDDEGLLVGMPDRIAIENEMLQAAGLFMPKAFGTKISNARDIGKEGLERILENLRSIKETGKTKREIQRFNFQTEVQRAEDKLVDNALAGKVLDTTIDASPVEETVIKKYLNKWNAYRDGHLNADFWALKAQSFSGDTVRAEGPFIDEVKRIHKARQGYNRDILAAEKDIMDTFSKSYGLKSTSEANKKMRELLKFKELGEFTLRNGKTATIKLNTLQMIAKWMQWQQTHTKIRLKQGNQWTDEIMATITSRLTKQDKQIGRFLIDDFYPKMADKADPVYENLTGLFANRVPNYSPSPTKTADIIPEHVKIAQQEARASLSPSSIKQRTNLLNLNPDAEVAPLAFDDPLITAFTHSTQMNRFIHFSEPVFFWRNLLKTGGQLRKALTQQFERQFPQQMERLLDDVARGRVKDVQNLNWLNSLTGNMATSILSINPTQAPKQLVSSLMWTIEESPKELAKWMPHYLKNARSIVDEMYENSSFLRARGKKKTFDRDAQFHQESKDMHNLVTGKQTFTDKGMFFVQFGDRGGILSFGGAFYSGRKAGYIAQGLPEKEAISKAIDDFEQAAKRIQQSGELEDIGMFQRSGGLARPLTLFQGTPLQFLRWEEHLMRSLGVFSRKGGPKAKGKILDILAKILLIHFNFAVFQMVSDFGFRKERVIRAGLLGPIGSLFILGSAIETFTRIVAGDDVFDKGNEVTGLTRMSDLFFDIPSSWKKAMTDATFENALEAGRVSIEAVLNLKGIPASNVTDIIESSFDFISQQESDPRTIIYSDYALDKKKKKPSGTSGPLDLTKDLDLGLDLDLGTSLDLDLQL